METTTFISIFFIWLILNHNIMDRTFYSLENTPVRNCCLCGKRGVNHVLGIQRSYDLFEIFNVVIAGEKPMAKYNNAKNKKKTTNINKYNNFCF